MGGVRGSLEDAFWGDRCHPRRVEGTRITLERSGGFGGLVARGALDTAQLAEPEAAEVAAALQLLREAPQEAGDAGRATVPDAQRYEFTLTSGGRTRRLVFDDLTLPAGARPLVDALLRRGAA